jgi:hypothetical protein
MTEGQALRKVASKRLAAEKAELELHDAMVAASALGIALRPIAAQAGTSPETARKMINERKAWVAQNAA